MKTNGVPPQLARSTESSMGTLLMWLLLGSLTMLFGASLVGYSYIRGQQPVWPPLGMPALPSGLIVSTAVILFSSLSLHLALLAAKRDRQSQLRLLLALTLVLGLAFLGLQYSNWLRLFADHMDPKTQYGFFFYFLTALHALHVVGGLVPLAVVMVKAGRGVYTRASHHGLVLVGMYWHFLAAIWLVLFSVLELTMQR